jgi:hypothetical protein
MTPLDGNMPPPMPLTKVVAVLVVVFSVMILVAVVLVEGGVFVNAVGWYCWGWC